MLAMCSLPTRIATILAGTYLGEYILHNVDDHRRIFVGLASLVLARIIDHRATIPVIKKMNTPEFKRHNLDKDFGESNPFLGKHPTIKQYITRTIPLELLILGMTYHIPLMGTTYLAISPIVYRNNTDARKAIDKRISQQGQ